MFVVNRKKIIFLIIFALMGYFVFCYINIFTSNNNLSEVSSLLYDEKVVIIDAGHGGEDGGAVSLNGIEEANINLNIALEIQKLLEQTGINVILTRSTDEAIYDADKDGNIKEKKISDLKNRVKIGNGSSADLFVSIHMNKISQTEYHGWQTFYRVDDIEGKRISELIQKNLNEAISQNNKRESKTIDKVFLIKKVTIPITIVECGFLSNQDELKMLITKEYQERLAWGIYTGIIEWFNNK